MSDDLEVGPDEIRTSAEVAKRTLALTAVVGLALGADRGAVLQWIDDNGLWDDLSPRERGFVDMVEPSRQQRIDATWQSECLLVASWALGLVDDVPPGDVQCDPAVLEAAVRPFYEGDPKVLVRSAVLRDEEELLVLQDRCFDLHWHARDGRINARPPRKPVDLDVIQERHRAINWICGYGGGLAWDDVTTDT